MHAGDLDVLIDQGDHDGLLRAVDARCERAAWEELATLRERCLRAVERGLQLWPIARQIEYRLALEAPAAWAAPVVVEGAGGFTLGPLPEVVAFRHEFRELAPHLPPGPAAGLTAHECVVRGEDLSADVPADADVLELPLHLEDWEPRYALAEYQAHEAHFPTPPPAAVESVELPPEATTPVEDAACAALVELVTPWTTESNGRSDVVAVDGDALAALRSLGLHTARLGRLDLATAVAHLAWAGASGGAHGRRRGAALGRFGAWWALAALTNLDWPPAAEELAVRASSLRWYAWDAGEPETGWTLHVAVENEPRGRTWALAATDAR